MREKASGSEGADAGRLHAVVQVAETGLTLEHVASFPLATFAPSSPAREAAERMRQLGFDVAGVDDEDGLHRYVILQDLEGKGPVDERSRSIDTRHLLPASLSLAEGLDALRRHPFYFVLRGRSVEGILTRADIQRPAVSMLTFGLILAAEAGLDLLITESCGDSWNQLLSEGRQDKAEQVLESRRRSNAELTLLDCLMLEDRICVLRKSRDLRERLEFASGAEVSAWGEGLKRLRDTLAHGGSLLDYEPDPQTALELVHDTRAAAHRVWQQVVAS